MDITTFLQNPLAGWGTVITIVILGIFSALNLIDRGRTDKQKRSDSADDRIIDILTKTIAVLEKKVKDLEEGQVQANTEITKLQSRNKMIEEIFAGRDGQTVEFQKRGFEIMAQFQLTDKKIDALIAVANQTQKNIEGLVGVLDKHLAKGGDTT